MRLNKDTTMYIKYSKAENDLITYYPDHQGKYLGYDIMKTITQQLKEYATDYDITSVKVSIKLKPNKIKELGGKNGRSR